MHSWLRNRRFRNRPPIQLQGLSGKYARALYSAAIKKDEKIDRPSSSFFTALPFKQAKTVRIMNFVKPIILGGLVVNFADMKTINLSVLSCVNTREVCSALVYECHCICLFYTPVGSNQQVLPLTLQK
ncbi:hypothetical protein PSHT_02284 [Puccinia striiformis]|uniref:ATP synthase subunit 5, mitochondrial n=1 Tax=Puccinia striiformis TaxID=27350 RepID=A0A2S4WII0_9BASI|nr:hypothetical protein PSHT_02284 [Puccinia striiformis]